jgi:hypothetical protein
MDAPDHTHDLLEAVTHEIARVAGKEVVSWEVIEVFGEPVIKQVEFADGDWWLDETLPDLASAPDLTARLTSLMTLTWPTMTEEEVPLIAWPHRVPPGRATAFGDPTAGPDDGAHSGPE